MSDIYALEVIDAVDKTGIALRLFGKSSTHLIEPEDRQSLGSSVKKSLLTNGYRGDALVLLIPSAWCWAASISLEGLPNQQRRDAMRFRFEQHLPVAIEQTACDFIPNRKNALAIGLDIGRVEDLLSALEHEGISIQWICPTAIVDAASLIGSGDVTSQLILYQEGGADLVEAQNGIITHWRSFLGGVENMLPYLRSEAKRKIDYVDPQLHKSLPAEYKSLAENQRAVSDRAERISAYLDSVIHKGKRLPINLRRDGISITDPVRAVRRPLMLAAVSVIVLLLLTTVAMGWRTHKLQQLADQKQQQQQHIFNDVFPGTPTPLLIRPRLESEHKRLLALSGTSNDLPESDSAMADLHALLIRLPDHIRYRILDIRIENNELFIDGEARSHSDTDVITIALRDQQGFEIQPPRIERLRGREGVRFTLTGIAPTRSTQPTPSVDSPVDPDLLSYASQSQATPPASGAHNP